MYWCPKDETALAEAEIEYQDDPCTTVYVKFQVRDDLGKLSQYGDLSKMYFVIWTTTIWTLPGNLAIAVHPRESYVLVKADNGEIDVYKRQALPSPSTVQPWVTHSLKGAPWPRAPTAVSRLDWNHPRYWSRPSI